MKRVFWIIIICWSCEPRSSMGRMTTVKQVNGVKVSMFEPLLTQSELEQLIDAIPKEYGTKTVFIDPVIYSNWNKQGVITYQCFLTGWSSHEDKFAILKFDDNIYLATSNKAENEKLITYFLSKYGRSYSQKEKDWMKWNYVNQGLLTSFKNNYPY